MLKNSIFLLALSVVLIGCSSSNDDAPAADPSSTTADGAIKPPDKPEKPENTEQTPNSSEPQSPSEQTARYKLTFNASWSAATHATNFPGDPHFSGLVGAVHNNQIIYWESGQIATAGIEQMAESGGKSGLLAEVDASIADGKAVARIDGGGVSVSPGSTEIEFEVQSDYPLLTVTTMLAPSPDWFAGVNSLSMLNEQGEFIDGITVDLFLYDAGTDSGLQYNSGNEDTQPRAIIQRLTAEPQDAPFVAGAPIIGQFVIEKI